MSQYFIDNIRVFSGQDLLKLYMYAEKPVSKNEMMAFASLGLRYNEGQELLNHPEYLDVNTRVVHFKSNKKWDRELLYKDRNIYLSYWDLINVHDYILSNRSHIVNPKYNNLTKNMNNWAKHAGIWSKGIGVHGLRVTRFVWLLKTFPDSIDKIIESMDYNPTKYHKLNMNDKKIEEYINIPFTQHELDLIKSLLCGWSGNTTT